MSGGALGAGARYLVGRLLAAVTGTGFPWGTLAVNLSGGLLMGLLVGSLARGDGGEGARLFLGVGVLGGFTTFSAFALDAVTLWRDAPLSALGYSVASVVGTILLLPVGLWMARSV